MPRPRSTRGQPHLQNLDRWQRLIEDGNLSSLRRVMTGLDTDSIQMREVSPMGGLLPQQERSAALGLLRTAAQRERGDPAAAGAGRM